MQETFNLKDNESKETFVNRHLDIIKESSYNPNDLKEALNDLSICLKESQDLNKKAYEQNIKNFEENFEENFKALQRIHKEQTLTQNQDLKQLKFSLQERIRENDIMERKIKEATGPKEHQEKEVATAANESQNKSSQRVNKLSDKEIEEISDKMKGPYLDIFKTRAKMFKTRTPQASKKLKKSNPIHSHKPFRIHTIQNTNINKDKKVKQAPKKSKNDKLKTLNKPLRIHTIQSTNINEGKEIDKVLSLISAEEERRIALRAKLKNLSQEPVRQTA
ncbi:MAG: hypothetical protein AAF443_06235 [Chlamydiota bacterium]